MNTDSNQNAEDIEGFLGLSSGALNSIPGPNPTFGCTIKQTFTASAGEILSFDWSFLTSEVNPQPDYNDFAFWSLTSPTLLANTYSAFDTSTVGGFNNQTEFDTVNFVLPASGLYTLGFGVFNAGDDYVSSGLLIDDVKIVPVPEPTTMVSVAMVLSCIGIYFRRRFKLGSPPD